MAISSKLLNEGETVVVDTRTHVKALLLPLLILVVLLAAGTFAQVTWDQTVAYVVWAVVAAGIVWYVLRPALIWATSSYTFTNRRLITRSGILVRRGHDMPIARISDIAYEFGLIDRMLGCGTLIISDASEHGQIKLHDIPNVEETQRKVNAMLHPSAGHDGT